MENQKRNMAQNSRKSLKKKRKKSPADYLTMMVVGKKGIVRTFRFSFRFLFWTSVLILLYISTSVFIFYQYLEERKANSINLTELKQMQHEIKETKKTLFLSKRRLEILEDSFQVIKTQEKIQAEPVAVAKKTVLKSPLPEVERKPIEKEEVQPVEKIEEKPIEKEEIQPIEKVEEKPIEKEEVQPVEKIETIPQIKFVDINGLVIKKKGLKLNIRFNIVNMRKDKRSVHGYVHIIAFDKNSDSPLFLAFPQIALKDGIPVEFKRGQPFSIRRFKTIKGRYLFNTETGPVSAIKILVYDKSGTLVFQKEYDAESAS